MAVLEVSAAGAILMAAFDRGVRLRQQSGVSVRATVTMLRLDHEVELLAGADSVVRQAEAMVQGRLNAAATSRLLITDSLSARRHDTRMNLNVDGRSPVANYTARQIAAILNGLSLIC